MSFGVLTCFTGHSRFHCIKVSQVMILSTPLRRACRDDRNGYIIHHIWSPDERVLEGYDLGILRNTPEYTGTITEQEFEDQTNNILQLYELL